ncbi:hypothetical protein GCM10027517_02730 [Phycicoccus ginsengisoli]
MLELLAVSMAVAGTLLAVLALYAAWRRDTPTGWSLAAVLGSVAWWGLAYAVELASVAVATKSLWGDLKYLGVSLLGPSFLCFVLQYTGRGHRVTRRLLLLLAVEPVVVMAALAVPATHDLVHHYPARVAPDQLVVVATGPLFWVHLVYVNALLVVATVLFMTSMVRLARTYRRLALLLMAAGLLPWVANFLHNGGVGVFARIDLTPFAFSLTGGVLVWGLFRERITDLAPLARSAVVETMADAVLVLDAFGRVADVNPAAASLLSATRSSLVGRRLTDVLPHEVRFAVATPDGGAPEVHIEDASGERSFDVQRQQLADGAGRPAGELIVLREVTDRVRARTELQRVLAEQRRVATALQASMVPGRLPTVPGCEVASAYHPAGDGGEVGGDFLDVFALGPRTWGFVLGDVSGKGAQAAAVSAAARYTIRALAEARHRPSRTLRSVNTRLLEATHPEQFCTVVYGQVEPLDDGVRLTFCLAGHPLPIVVQPGVGSGEHGVPGTVLGLLEDPELHDTTLVLRPGDLLCAFTDGLVESRRGQAMFGTGRVESVLTRQAAHPSERVLEALLGAVRDFHGGVLEDDLAVLLLRAEPASAEAVDDLPDDTRQAQPAGE